MHSPSPPSRTGRPVYGGDPLDDRKALPRRDVDRADRAARQVDRPRRADAHPSHGAIGGGNRVGEQLLGHRPDRLCVAPRRRQLRAVQEVALRVDDADGDLRATDVEREGRWRRRCSRGLAGGADQPLGDRAHGGNHLWRLEHLELDPRHRQPWHHALGFVGARGHDARVGTVGFDLGGGIGKRLRDNVLGRLVPHAGNVAIRGCGDRASHVAGSVGSFAREERGAARHDVGHPVEAKAAPVVSVAVVAEQIPAPARRHQLIRLQPTFGGVAVAIDVAGAHVLAVARGPRQGHEDVGFDELRRTGRTSASSSRRAPRTPANAAATA